MEATAGKYIPRESEINHRLVRLGVFFPISKGTRYGPSKRAVSHSILSKGKRRCHSRLEVSPDCTTSLEPG